jgi:hypothetical protein
MPYVPPTATTGFNLLMALTGLPPAMTVQTATVQSANFTTDATARSVRLEVLSGTATWAGVTFVAGEFREYTDANGGVVTPIAVAISSGSVRYEWAS